MILIDPPSPFDTVADWQRFLKSMNELAVDNPDDEDVRVHIKLAEETIATLSA